MKETVTTGIGENLPWSDNREEPRLRVEDGFLRNSHPGVW